MFVDLTTHAKKQITSILASEIVEVKQMEPGKTLVLQRHAQQGQYVTEDREWIIAQIKDFLEPIVYLPRGNEYPEPLNVQELMGYERREKFAKGEHFKDTNFFTAKEGDTI